MISLLTKLSFLIILRMRETKVTKLSSCRKSVAIIGGGAGGIISAYVLLNNGFDVTILEQNCEIGGVWNYNLNKLTSDSGKKSSLKVNPMYKGLRTNLPKEIMAFNREHPFDLHLQSYLSHYDVMNYLEDFYNKYNLHTLTSLSTEVIECIPGVSNLVESETSWTVKYKCLKTGTHNEKLFDFVVVCNGHYNEVCDPTDIENIDSYLGIKVHSKDYDVPEQFAGARVLVVGARSSATDIARELDSCASVPAIHVSDRHFDPSSSTSTLLSTAKAPGSRIRHHSGIRRFLPNTKLVEFSDGSTAEVDVIIWCTGYLYNFPFLQSSFHSTKCDDFHNKRCVRHLYQQIFSVDHPSLAFVGLPWSVIPFPLFYIQALAICKAFSCSSAALPSSANMRLWLEQFECASVRRNADNELDTHMYHYLGGSLQFDYMRDLINTYVTETEAAVTDTDTDAAVTDTDTDAVMKYDSKIELLRYISFLEEIYSDNSRNKPAFVGAPDTYRDRQYLVDIDTLTWSVQ